MSSEYIATGGLTAEEAANRVNSFFKRLWSGELVNKSKHSAESEEDIRKKELHEKLDYCRLEVDYIPKFIGELRDRGGRFVGDLSASIPEGESYKENDYGIFDSNHYFYSGLHWIKLEEDPLSEYHRKVDLISAEQMLDTVQRDNITDYVKRNTDYEGIYNEVLKRLSSKPLIEHKCHNCGAPVKMDYSSHLFKCPYCQSVYLFDREQVFAQ